MEKAISTETPIVTHIIAQKMEEIVAWLRDFLV